MVTRVSLLSTWNNPPTEEEMLESLISQDANIDEVEAFLEKRRIPIRREGGKLISPFDGETIFEPACKSNSTSQLKAFVAGYLYARRSA